MRIKLTLLSFLCLLLWHDNAIAAITLTNGYWSTSFVGCTANPARYGYTCDGLDMDDSGYPNDYCPGSPNQYSIFGSGGNYSGGGGGNGLRVYYHGNDRNVHSAALRMNLPPGVGEFWLRFYHRFPVGQTMGGIFESKLIFVWTDAGNSVIIQYPYGSNGIEFAPMGTSMGASQFSNGGLRTIFNGSTTADGSWHFYELRLKLGSGTAEADFWVDGVNYVHLTGLAGWGASATRWTHLIFPYNHNVFMLSGCNPHDVDDVAVATPSFSGFVHDSAGRQMIGGLQGGKKPSPVMNIVPPSSN